MQRFAVRNNKAVPMSQSRPVRSARHAEGSAPQAIAEDAAPALPSLVPLDRTGDVFTRDPL